MKPDTGYVVEMRGLRVEGYSGESWSEIVKGVSLEVRPGRVLGLIGESGAGKSTIGVAAMGWARPGCRFSGGQVLFKGRDLLTLSEAELDRIRGDRVSYVAQSASAAFNPAHRLIDQVIEPILIRGAASRRAAETRAMELFEKLGLPNPETIGFRYPHQVSGGQLQRVMTAMALAPKPDLVVFDEPTTALDVTTQVDVLAAIKEAIEDEGSAALYITHDLAVVAQVSHEIMVLRHGREVERGETGRIISAPSEGYTKQLVAVRAFVKPAAAPPPEEPLLSASQVTAVYAKTFMALSDVSLSVKAGETLAIVGESGSGKSTMARVISGLLPPVEGTIRFDGAPLPPALQQRTKEQLRTLQMIYQSPDLALNPRQTVREVIGRPLQFYFGRDGAAREKRVRELLDRTQMPAHLIDRYPGELSGGQKQRVCIARALAADPKLIICDEPTSALDPLVADGVLKLLTELQKDTGVAYLFITHDIAIVRAIADHVVVMRRGEVVRSGPKDAALSPPFDDYTDLMLKSVPELRPGWLEETLSTRRIASGGQ